MAGRKPANLPNPFVIEGDNLLWEDDRELDIRVDDVVIGCVRAFHADKPATSKQEFVHWFKVVKIYRNCDELTTTAIEDYLQCSTRQAQRYMKVLKLTNLMLNRYLKQREVGDTRGYVQLSDGQVRSGYLNRGS